MDRRTFVILCHLLRTVAGLSLTEIVDVEEMVAMFLHILMTYIKVNVPAADRLTFRMRKREITTNVLGVCNTKEDFVYVLAGWEDP
ncbi:putative nuclease HARBI1 [Cucumis melo var. makuwa]|nr:putative nuclease HARBI1 [Cucumis melo var. makuwa]